MRGWVWLVCAAALLCGGAGCATKAVIVRPEKELREASREDLLLIVEENMRRLETLQARADVRLVKQDVLVPVMGSSERKAFLRVQVDGLLFLQRSLSGGDDTRNVYFHGAVMGGKGFGLLGVGDKFWVSMANPGAGEPGEPNGYVITGDVYVKRSGGDGRGRVVDGTRRTRPPGLISARPQDLLDLLLFDEVFELLAGSEGMMCYRETWDDYYVLTFLRSDWREHIVSRIWIERKELRVAIHQIFDGNGEVLAEARFGQYQRHKVRGGELTVEVPRVVWLLWPRDYTVMEVNLLSLQVNEAIPERRWSPRPKAGYREVSEDSLTRERLRGSLVPGD